MKYLLTINNVQIEIIRSDERLEKVLERLSKCFRYRIVRFDVILE